MSLPVITITTDFGHRSGFVGVMKGVILGIAPEAVVVDISHEVAPQDILEAQFLLERAEPYFPVGTIHVAVVDPGVGTGRRPILAQTSRCIFVGPDNGIFTPWLDGAEIRRLDKKRFFNKEVSSTFHGRDIFAPVAGHLAQGRKPEDMGSIITDPVRKSLPHPTITSDGIEGEVVYIDSFGNLITNIFAEMLDKMRKPVIRIGRRRIKGLADTYLEAPAGKPCALIGSHGRIEIAVPMANAAELLGISMGQKVEIGPG